MKHLIDATNKKLGRVATEAASILLGKNSTDFAKNKDLQATVEIKNTSKAFITIKKQQETEYVNYSGYPGGLKTSTMKQIKDVKGFSELFRKAVSGMLPNNKLKNERMKRLIISE